MPSPNSSSTNQYVIDIESGAETARLIEQDKLMTRAMDGLLPEQSDLSHVKRILDIACGPGGWAIEVAFTYPDMEVVGIDINKTMVEYARALAFSRGYDNVHFQVMDIKKGLDFPDASFDLINARFIFGLMDQTSWPILLSECKRILRPGGRIRLTELEDGVSNSLSLQRLKTCFYQILAAQKRTYSVAGHSVGVAYMFKPLLRQAGFEQIDQRPFLIDSSSDSPLHASSRKDTEVAFALLKPYVLASGMLDEVEYDTLYRQMLIDMFDEGYVGLGFSLLTWAVKPASAHEPSHT